MIGEASRRDTVLVNPSKHAINNAVQPFWEKKKTIKKFTQSSLVMLIVNVDNTKFSYLLS